MDVIPFLKKPTVQKVLEYNKIPCYADVQRVILAECEKNNKILLVGDASCHPSETIVYTDFAEKSKNQYDNLKSGKRKDGTYQYLLFSDNAGACQINFGRIVENEI